MPGTPLKTFEDVLTFGKYKGQTIGEVFDENPQWLEWAMENVEGFDFDEKDKDAIYDAAYEAQQEFFRDRE